MFDGGEIVAHDKGADGGAADDHQLIGQGMENDLHLAAGDDVTAEDHAERNDNA